MNRSPMTRQRSEWQYDDAWAAELHDLLGLRPTTCAHRRVGDGVLSVVVAEEPEIGWHLSISHRGHNGRAFRYPRWDEIAQARDRFLPADLGFVMHLPPASEYVALHDTTFHLHQHPASGTRSSTA